MEERQKFIGYEMRGGHHVALLQAGYDNKPSAFDRPSLETRFQNLQAGGWACEQTAAALAGFPKD